jgi:hypothetical protein
MNVNAQLLEHRWGIRMTLDAAAEVRIAEGRSVVALVRDASLSGAFLESAARLPLLARISVRPLSKADWLEACVVRVEPSGLAIEWLDPGLHPVYVFLSHNDATGILEVSHEQQQP